MTTMTGGRVAAGRNAWSLGPLLRSLGEEWKRRRVYREAVRELRALSERELADLGISRSMISRVAMEAASGKAKTDWRKTLAEQ